MKTRSIPTGRAQLRLLSSPVRFSLYSSLRADGPATARELAARLGKDEMLLYYHLRQMSEHGIVGTSSRPTATKPETVFQALGPFVVEDIDLEDAENRREVQRNIRTIFRRATEELTDAAEELQNGFHDQVALARMSVRLKPEHAAELRLRLAELREWVEANDGEGERIGLTIAVSPIVGRP